MMKKLTLPLTVVIVILLIGIYLYTRPLPALKEQTLTPALPQSVAVEIPWPTAAQAAIGAQGYGLLESKKSSGQLPMGSIAKIITAMSVLKQKPIPNGSQGANIALDSTDVDYFNYYSTNDGSAVKVTDGENITEYQALQALLLPSANNIGDSLARWAFGSPQNYFAYANNMLKAMGLTQTTIGDTNGFSDTSISTASDLVTIGLKAIQQPVIADIVNQSSADLPVAGTVKNVNWLLGTDGVNGIKTGNTDKAGGCYLFSAKHTVAGQDVTLVGAILGAPNLTTAISGARPLLESVDSGFVKTIVIKKGDTLANYSSEWGSSTKAVAARDVSVLAWKDQMVNITNQPNIINSPANTGANAGLVSVKAGSSTASSPLVLAGEIPNPSWHWRLIHK